MNLLITRPETDAADTGRQLEQRGHQVVLSPLLTIEPISVPASTIETWSGEPPGGAIFTSRNALAALEGQPWAKQMTAWPCHFVGAKTAQLGRRMGLSGPGFVASTAMDLGQALIDANARGEAVRERGRPLVHFSGAQVARDLAGELSAHGIPTFRLPVYRAVAAEAFNEAALQALEAGTLDAVLFYSPRTAQIFVDLAGKSQIGGQIAALTAVCLSPAVASALDPISTPWQRVAVAEKPKGKEMLALIDRLAAQLRP